MTSQLKLPGVDDFFLKHRLEESRAVVKEVAEKTEKPLIIQFSGGRDSMALLGLVREVTNDFVCSYMATGLEFSGVIQFVKEICDQFNIRLIISHPGLHKGNIFKRIEQFQSFPNLGSFNGGGKRLWCCRDLKLRPQKKLLHQLFGKGTFYKLEGIRLYESVRRRYIYKDYVEHPLRPDGEHSGSFEVFPIINWTDSDVLNYLEMVSLPTLGHYDKYGVSGCSWCPFYGVEIYSRVLADKPNHYDRFIQMEEKLGIPSVMGGVYLRDIKRAVVDGSPLPVKKTGDPVNSPCMMMFEGEMVKTCDVYGHFYVDGVCFRCGKGEETSHTLTKPN